MELPNYFLADLPPETAFSEAMVRDACSSLRRNRERYLAVRSTTEMMHLLAELAAQWQRPDFTFRQMALRLGPPVTGFSEPVLREGLDRFFSEITVDNLESLLAQDVGSPERFDEWTASEPEQDTGRKARIFGPDLMAHFTAGNIPAPALMSMVLGLLTRSAQFVKCARGTSLLPRLFAHSLYAEDAKLASCLELAEWPGGQRTELEQVLFEVCEAVTATGDDETLRSIRDRLPAGKRFTGYGHKVSFGLVTKDVLSRAAADRWIQAAAEDVAAWDQLGCLSPHDLYVEDGGAMSAEMFAERLADALEQKEKTHPRGPLSVELSALLQTRRGLYQMRAGADDHTRVWHSRDSTAWTIVFERDPLFQPSCLHRFVYVKPVADVEEVLKYAEPVRGQVSTVGLAAAGSRARNIAARLAAWGVSRICPLGRMQQPPLGWRHDGRPALGDLVRWVDWEGERR